jgi:hypothetical protein
MISIDLVDVPVNVQEFKSFSKENEYILFLGFFIKNEYDNRRLKINYKFNPQKFLYQGSIQTPETLIPLYGVILNPNINIQKLFKTIESQEKIGITLPLYKNILAQHNLTCDDTYGYFNSDIQLYPIDFLNLKMVCNDIFNIDKKIFQHLLDIEENHFDFQKFASLKLLILKI